MTGIKTVLLTTFIGVAVAAAGCGKDGKDGADGMDGMDGMDGKDGADGMDGMDGADGMDATDSTESTDATGGADGTGGDDGMGGADGMGGGGGMGGADGMGGGGMGGADDEVLHDLYVGCRDAMGSVQHYEISNVTGEVTLIDTASTEATTSNFAINADETLVYIAHADEGRITTLSRDTTTGTLSVEDFISVPGNAEGDEGAQEPYNVDCLDADNPDAPTNPATQTLTLSPAEDFIIASNWCANTVLVYAINADGTVGDLNQTVIDGAKSHHAVFDSTGGYVLVPYFGSDFVAAYEYDADTGMLAPVDPLTTEVPEENGSSGPRHATFHPSEASWFYTINETGGSISFFIFDDSDGTLEHQATISSLPDDSPFTVEDMNRSGAEIEIDPSGEHLYVSNRVDEMENGSIGVYSIDQDNGTLTPIEWVDTGGVTPRLFSLSPDGQLLVVTNQGSDNMTVFTVDDATGELTTVATTDVCEVPFFARMVAP